MKYYFDFCSTTYNGMIYLIRKIEEDYPSCPSCIKKVSYDDEENMIIEQHYHNREACIGIKRTIEIPMYVLIEENTINRCIFELLFKPFLLQEEGKREDEIARLCNLLINDKITFANYWINKEAIFCNLADNTEDLISSGEISVSLKICD